MSCGKTLIKSLQSTVKSVYTAAGTYFPSSLSYHSAKALSPQSAVLSGVMVLGRAATTDHTHVQPSCDVTYTAYNTF